MVKLRLVVPFSGMVERSNAFWMLGGEEVARSDNCGHKGAQQERHGAMLHKRLS